MTNRVKIGPRVNEELWNRFRNDVEERKGQTRGVIGDELENAIREYLRDDSSPTERRIEKRVARIEEAVGAAPTDGGTDTFAPGEHTHAPSRLDVTEKPSANEATDKKVAYLAGCLRDKLAGEFQEVPRSVIVDVVKDEYGFRSDTAKRYVERVSAYFDLIEHPANDKILVTEERRNDLVEQRREQLQNEADDKL